MVVSGIVGLVASEVVGSDRSVLVVASVFGSSVTPGSCVVVGS